MSLFYDLIIDENYPAVNHAFNRCNQFLNSKKRRWIAPLDQKTSIFNCNAGLQRPAFSYTDAAYRIRPVQHGKVMENRETEKKDLNENEMEQAAGGFEYE